MKEYLKSKQKENTYSLLERYPDGGGSSKGWFILHYENPVTEKPTDGKIVGMYSIIYDECLVEFYSLDSDDK